jgi:hypothetical protein
MHENINKYYLLLITKNKFNLKSLKMKDKPLSHFFNVVTTLVFSILFPHINC